MKNWLSGRDTATVGFFVVFLTWSSPSIAQSIPQEPSPKFIPAVHAGIPQILSLTLGVGWLHPVYDGIAEQGPFLVVEPGLGDIRGGIGYSQIGLISDMGIRVSILQTWFVEWVVPNGRRYAGIEAHRAFLYGVVRVGVFRRIDDQRGYMIGGSVGLGSF